MLKEYLAGLSGHDVTVLGIGVSNLPLISLLAGAGARVTARDLKTRQQLGPVAGQLEAQGVRLVLGPQYLDALPPVLTFCTPGINPRRREVAQAAANGAKITSEMDLFMQVCPCTVIGITGSEGKTTTTTLIYEMLCAAGKKAWLGGNIGTPLLDKADQMSAEDYAVVELSSFQLMLLSRSPHISVITNITPNHLDVHTDMEEYIQAKCAVFAGQAAGDLAVFNADNEITAQKALLAPAGVRMFSRQGRVSQPGGGVWLEGDTIYSAGVPVMQRGDIRLPGLHNVENYMAAIAALEGVVPHQAMVDVARRFAGIEHRLELVREKDGVKYYNDSIASSPTRAIAGLRCFDGNIILIAGGYDKKLPFDQLGAEIPGRVGTLLLCGDTADKIEAAVRAAPGFADGHPRILHYGSLDALVCSLPSLAQPGDTVLLSPACASFDQFKNFHERGVHFKKLVMTL